MITKCKKATEIHKYKEICKYKNKSKIDREDREKEV